MSAESTIVRKICLLVNLDHDVPESVNATIFRYLMLPFVDESIHRKQNVKCGH